MRGKSKKLRKKKLLQKNILLIVLLVVLIICLFLLMLFQMFVHFKDYYSIESRVSNISMMSNQNKENYRTVGWVRVQGTNLDLPVLSGIDDNTHFPVEMERYVWNVNNDGKFYNKMNIMGHNIFNLSSQPKLTSDDFKRFEELMSFVYYDFAKDNKYIQLTIDGKNYLYKIFAVDFINAVDVDMFPTGNYSKEDLQYQINLFQENNLYDYDVDVNADDQLISLITCTRFYGNDNYIDFVVSGRLVRENEKIDNYSVKKTHRYDEVEKILKGDDDNESESSM